MLCYGTGSRTIGTTGTFECLGTYIRLKRFERSEAVELLERLERPEFP
jgi:hypothetical protein